MGGLKPPLEKIKNRTEKMYSYWIKHDGQKAILYVGYSKREAISRHREQFAIKNKRVNLVCVKATDNKIYY